MIIHYIKKWLLLLFTGLWFLLPASAQQINSLSPSELPFGAYITGLYHLEADDGNGLYIKEQADGTLITAALDTSASAFYFWLVENVYEDTFWLYSATRQGELLQINTDETTQWTTEADTETSKLLFRMDTAGPERTAANEAAEIVAMGYITTGALSANPGNTDCQCNFLTVSAQSKFKLHDSGIQVQNYRPVVFQKTDTTNTLGVVTMDTVNNVTRISQSPPVTGIALPNTFVSSSFFVKDFGADDFEITVSSGAEGYIGFLNYTDHHYTKEVYKSARSKIGIKIANDVISLFYGSGDQLLPSGSLNGEIVTDFVTGTPFTMGFKGQDSLVVRQDGSTYALTKAAPAELFFNRSVTQSARMLVQLVKDTLEIAYTTKNNLINSENDMGTDDGSHLVSTRPFLPYNKGGTLVNTFDWQETQWKVRYEDAGTVSDTVFSPFYSSNTEFSGISARYDPSGNYEGGEDFATSEGWELIKADLGYNADGTVRPQAPYHPYVMLYDKVSGKLRVFVYTNNESIANQLTVSLSVINARPSTTNTDTANTYVPKLWGSLQQFASLDKVQNSVYSKALPFYSASGRSWYFADFIMEYDPCIAFFESTVTLQVYKTTEGDLTMVGRFEGGSLPAGTNEYNEWQDQRDDFLLGVMDNNFGTLQNTLGDITFNQYETFDLMDFESEVGGTLVGAPVEAWEKEKARIEWKAQQTIGEATIAEGVATIVQGAAQVAEAFPFAEKGAKMVGGAATMAAGAAQIVAGDAELRLAYANKLYYDHIKDKEKHEDQEIVMQVPPPRPQAVFGEMALQGTLSIQTALIPESFIATPGGFDSNNAPEWYGNGTRGASPLYNKPMGKFNLLKQPEFAIGVVKNDTTDYYGAWLKIKEKPYFAHNNTAAGKIDDMLSINIHVKTMDDEGKVADGVTGQGGYTLLFETQNSNALPGEIDITSLVDWDQINANIDSLGDPDEEDIENELAKWIKVSYEVWSLTLTNLKSRNLERVFANAKQYYTGNSNFTFDTNYTLAGDQLVQAAKTLLAEAEFSDYNFSDDSDFGTNYQLYHTTYDDGDEFSEVMKAYCIALRNAQNPMAKNAGNTGDIKGGEVAEAAEEEETPVTGESTVIQPDLTVYPNPARHQVSFNLVSEQAGKSVITLYDLTGRALISSTDILNGRDILQGHVNIAALPAGIYILEVKLPDGKSITKKIIKQ